MIIDSVITTVARDMQLIKQLGLHLRYASTIVMNEYRIILLFSPQLIRMFMLIILPEVVV